jgi:hypothetical protein
LPQVVQIAYTVKSPPLAGMFASAVQAVAPVVVLPPVSLGYESDSVMPGVLLPRPPPTALGFVAGHGVVSVFVPAPTVPEFFDVVIRLRVAPVAPFGPAGPGSPFGP